MSNSGQRRADRSHGESGMWSLDELWEALAEFEDELKRAKLAPNTVNTYVGRSEIFLRWLAGQYTPEGPRS